MLSRKLLREEHDRVREELMSRGIDGAAVDAWIELDSTRRATVVELEELKRRRNEASN